MTHCDCGHDVVSDGFTPGHATETATGRKLCHDCCAVQFKAKLMALAPGGKVGGYLIDSMPERERRPRYWAQRKCLIRDADGLAFTDWTGKYSTNVKAVKYSMNNFGAVRIDFWFSIVVNGDTIQHYHGVNVGDQQYATVQRVKKARY